MIVAVAWIDPRRAPDRRDDVAMRFEAEQWAPWRDPLDQLVAQIADKPRKLRAAIDAPNDSMTFLVTDYGKPFASAAAFGNKFADWCVEAKLPAVDCEDGRTRNYRAHGLRKAALRALTHAGARLRRSWPSAATQRWHRSRCTSMKPNRIGWRTPR